MNVRIATVLYSDIPLYEVGICNDDGNAWPIAINYLQLGKHSHVTPTTARNLAQALTAAADACEQLGVRVEHLVGDGDESVLFDEGASGGVM